MIRQWKMSQTHKSTMSPSVTPAKHCFYLRQTEKDEITLDSDAAAAPWPNMLSVPGSAEKSVVVPLPPQNSPHCPWHALRSSLSPVSRPTKWLIQKLLEVFTSKAPDELNHCQRSRLLHLILQVRTALKMTWWRVSKEEGGKTRGKVESQLLPTNNLHDFGMKSTLRCESACKL